VRVLGFLRVAGGFEIIFKKVKFSAFDHIW